MASFFELSWITLFGISFLFVGGFVLWVYGTHTPQRPVEISGVESQSTHKFHHHLVQWFFLYGVVAVIFGICCLVGAALASL